MRITEELLRKKAEHNESMLSNLEEIALHQLNIEKIELFDKLCRHIQILLLQNNLIEKIENLSKLKELKYINLALNNISLIEGLENCESLEKIDMTCNFIDAENFLESCWNIKKCPSLKEIYLTGNPCTDFGKFREILIAVADNLQFIDGKEILPSERIVAKQNYNQNVDEMEVYVKQQKEKISLLSAEEKAKRYTKEYRKKLYEETSKNQPAEEKKTNPEKSKISSQFLANGEMRQCNEGKYDFTVQEYDDPKLTTFTLKIPKFLDTSLVKVEIYPFFISIRIKDKLTQIKTWNEVRTTPVSLQRSTTTGELMIKLEKIDFDQVLANKMKKEDKKITHNLKKDIPKEEIIEQDEDIPELE